MSIGNGSFYQQKNCYCWIFLNKLENILIDESFIQVNLSANKQNELIIYKMYMKRLYVECPLFTYLKPSYNAFK